MSLYPITGDVNCDYVVRVYLQVLPFQVTGLVTMNTDFVGRYFGTFKCPASQHTLPHYL